MKESNFDRIDNAVHNWGEDCWKFLKPLAWVFFPGILAVIIADNKCASLKFKMTFIYEKKVQVPVPLAWTEDSLPTFLLPKGFWKVFMFGSRRFLFLTPIVIGYLHPVQAVLVEFGVPLMSRMVAKFPFSLGIHQFSYILPLQWAWTTNLTIMLSEGLKTLCQVWEPLQTER